MDFKTGKTVNIFILTLIDFCDTIRFLLLYMNTLVTPKEKPAPLFLNILQVKIYAHKQVIKESKFKSEHIFRAHFIKFILHPVSYIFLRRRKAMLHRVEVFSVS